MSTFGKIIFLFPLIFYLLGIYPGVGGEGGQRELLKLDQKIDWWNFLTVFIYGGWPGNESSWKYTLTIFQIMLYLIGSYLVYVNLVNKLSKKLFLILSLIGLLFVSQVLRDASMLTMYIFSLGLLLQSGALKKNKKTFLILLSFIFALLGSLFRPVFAPLFGLVYILILLKNYTLVKSKLLLSILLIVISVLPFFLDKFLSDSNNLSKSFPEQQVMIYDLTKLNCWGHQERTKELARIGLYPLLSAKNNFESVCATLTPAGWDHLRSKVDDVENSPVLIQIGNNEEKFEALRKSWLMALMNSPFEWLLVKTIDLSQVLFMANSFNIPQFFDSDKTFNLFKIGDYFLKLYYLPINALDQFRFFSIISTLFFGLALLSFSAIYSKFTNGFKLNIIQFISLNIISAIFMSLTYVANNGRYSFPFVYVSYIFLIIGYDTDTKLTLKNNIKVKKIN